MMRRQRKAFPLVVLLGFEVAAIVGLQAAGSAHAMQVPWGNLSTWADTSTVTQLATPIIRLMALALAYWMLVSTALCVLAQVSRIPSAMRATSMFALPSVRRVVDGAMVMSLATTSFVGIGATAAFAADQPSAPASTDITTSIAASPDDLSVPTPTVGATDGASVATPTVGATDDTTTSTSAPDTTTTSAPDTTSTSVPDDTTTTGVPDTTSTSVPDDTTTTGVPDTTSTSVPDTTSTTPLTSSPGDGWVVTPSPGSDDPAAVDTPPLATTTTVPQGPSTPAVSTPSPDASATPSSPDTTAAPSQVLAQQDHRVAAGENLWTISRDAIAASTGAPASSVSEGQIRDYWLKVIDANRDNLRSKDPHWIFPGEVITLPSVDNSANAGS